MANTSRIFACAVALVVPAIALSQTARPAASDKGSVLLLENERIFEGDIEKIGDQYRVRRPTGGETWIPGGTVMRLCASRLEAYQHLRKQANLNDPDELLRLAQWCQLQELREQALAEVRAAFALRPEHEETRRLLTNLERASLQAAPPPSPPKPMPRTELKATATAAAGIELNTECMGLFARRVQPILMNTCADCHASGRAGEFKLTQVFGDAPLGGKSSQQNLTAVLSQIKPDQPLGSPLLRMAASAHGGATQPPLKSRQTPAYKALEQWVQLTAAHAPKARRTDIAQEHETKSVFENVETNAVKENSAPKKPEPAKARENPAEPVDEFDPVIFNRQMHPEKK